VRYHPISTTHAIMTAPWIWLKITTTIYPFVDSANEVETNRTGGDIHVDPDLLSSVIDKREYVEVHRDCDINSSSSSSSSAEHDGYSRWNKQSSDNGRCVSEDFEFL